MVCAVLSKSAWVKPLPSEALGGFSEAPFRFAVKIKSAAWAFDKPDSDSIKRSAVLTARFIAPTPFETPEALLRWAISERSEEHTSELQSLMRISYAVFCLQKKTILSTNRPI